MKTRGAVILERFACGAGATNWYYCPDSDHLEAIEARLGPGSLVSFYFDDRIQHSAYSPELRTCVEDLISKKRDTLIGYIEKDGIGIRMVVDVEPGELDEYHSELASAHLIFYGEYPAAEDDGVNAVTVTLPDTDGIVQRHPHEVQL